MKKFTFALILIVVFLCAVFMLACNGDNNTDKGSDEPTISYTVTFESNGGSRVDSIPKELNAEISTEPLTTREDYTFLGWYEDASISGNRVIFPYKVTEDRTLYAKWEKLIITYNVTFMVNDTVWDVQEVVKGSAAVNPSEPGKDATVQYTYSFSGWDKSFDNVQHDMTVNAVFSQTVNKYKICISDPYGLYDGSPEMTVNYGTTLTLQDLMQDGSDFSGWKSSVSGNIYKGNTYTVTGNDTLTALWNISTYFVLFKNFDGALLESVNVEYGKPAVYTKSEPIRTATDEYTYNFTGWDVPLDSIITDTVAVAQFSEKKNEYRYTFYDDDGVNVLKTAAAEYGSEIIAPVVAAKHTAEYAYTFKEWSPAFKSGTMLTGNSEYTAVYTRSVNKFTVTLMDPQGVYQTNSITDSYGAILSLDNLSKEGHIFAGWQSGLTGNVYNGSGYTVSGNDTLTAKWDIVTYKVSFLNWDGALLDTISVEHGSTAAYTRKNPVRDGTAECSYNFIGWNISLENIKADRTATAQFAQQTNQYTYRFLSDDGVTVLKEKTINYGSVIFAPSVSDRSTAEYNYIFAGWLPSFTEGDTIDNNIDYIAVFTRTTNKYAVEFDDPEGVYDSSDGVLSAYGTTLTLESLSAEGKTFIGWKSLKYGNIYNGSEYTVIDNDTLTAQWDIDSYTVQFRNWDGTLLLTVSAEYGSEAKYTLSPPERTPGDEFSYEFAGWDISVESITENTVVTARYNEVIRKYTYVFYDDDGVTVLRRATETFGTEIVAPSSPEKNDTVFFTFAFSRWIGYESGMTVTGDVSFKAEYRVYDKIVDVSSDFAFIVYCEGDSEYIRNNLKIYYSYFYDDSGYSGVAVEYIAAYIGGGEWRITPGRNGENNEYLYKSGYSYTVEASGSVKVENYEWNVLTFNIVAEDSEIVEYKTDGSIIYLRALEIEKGKNYNYLFLDTSGNSGLPNAEDEYVDVAISNADGLKIGDIVCLGNALDDTGIDTDSFFGKIAFIEEYSDGQYKYIITFVYPEISEIFDELDIYYNEEVDLESNLELSDEVSEYSVDALYASDDFVTFLASASVAAYQYLEEGGFSTRAASPESFMKNIKITPKFAVSGTKFTVSLTGAIDIPIKTSAGLELGNISISFSVSAEVKFEVSVNYKLAWKWFIPTGLEYFDVRLTQSDVFGFSFSLKITMEYSLEEDDHEHEGEYVYSINSLKLHFVQCRYVQNIHLENRVYISADELNEYLRKVGFTACIICKPDVDLDNDNLVINTNTNKVHCANCYHAEVRSNPANIVQTGKSIERLKKEGYAFCSWCQPENDFANKMSKALLYSDWSSVLGEIKSLAEQSGTAAADNKRGISLFKTNTVVCYIISLEFEVRFVLDFKLEINMTYEYQYKNTTTYGLMKQNGNISTYTSKKSEVTSELSIIGSAELKVGLEFTFKVGIVGLTKWINVAITAEVGVYVDVAGIVKATITEYYAAAYMEIGVYYDVKVSYKLFSLSGSKSIIKDEIPIIALGYEKAYYAYENYEEVYELSGNKSLNELEVLSVKYYDLKNMKEQTGVLNPNGVNSAYSVVYTFDDGNGVRTNASQFIDIVDGVIVIKQNSPCTFSVTVYIEVISTSGWVNLRKGGSIFYLGIREFRLDYKSHIYENGQCVIGGEYVEYTVIYHANGGSDYEGSTVFTAENINIFYAPEKEGYAFDGWYNNAGFSGEKINTTAGIYSNITLYAKWLKVYTITYILGGNGINGNGNPLTYTSADSIVLANPERYGYSFTGWSGGIIGIPAGSTGNITLTAEWTPIVYNIIYELGGGTNHENNPSSYTVEDEVTLIAPERNGYIFTGWSENIPQGSVGDRTLIASWEAVEYTITYHLGGGTKDIDNPDHYTIEDMIILGGAERGHYNFAGWYDNEEFNGDAVSVISVSTGNIELYASWVPVEYSITYHFNGGDAVSNPGFHTVEDNALILSDPSRRGYTFAGWYDNAGLAGVAVTAVPANSTGEIHLYAAWNINTYYIIYYLNGGELAESDMIKTYTVNDSFILPEPTISDQLYEFGGWYLNEGFIGNSIVKVESMSESFTLYACWIDRNYKITYIGGYTPTNIDSYTKETEFYFDAAAKDGYKFLGWYGNDAFTGEEIKYIARGSTGNITLYAKWEIITYLITYELGEGINSAGNPSTYTVEDEISLADPTKKGYTFDGWLEYSDGLIRQGTTGDIKLTAMWSICRYNIYFEPNGGTYPGSAAPGFTIEEDFQIDYSERTGYTFEGWYLNEDFTGDEISYISLGTTGDMTLYAKWDIIVYNIIYELNGGTGVNPDTYTVEDFVMLVDPEKDGYYFLGWTDGITGFGPGNIGDIYITAIWETIEYRIYYDNDAPYANIAATYNIETETFILGEAIKDGYKFLGWYGDTAFTGEVITYIAQGSTGDIYLNAKWEIIKYSITYQLDEGINSSGNPNTYTVEDEIWIADPTKNGYIFDGWEECTDGLIRQGTTGDIKLTAKWSICWYTVELELNGGSYFGSTELGFTIEDDLQIADAERTGYVFKGWYLNENFTGDKILYIALGTTGDITLYAKWDIIVYTITFNDCDIQSDTYTVETGFSFDTLIPEKSGYTFMGWVYDIEPMNERGILYGDIAIKAQWDIIYYTISFDGNGGSTPGYIIYTIEDTDITLPIPVRDGYNFDGWIETEPPASEVADKFFLAQWTPIVYNIIYELNGGTGVNPDTYTVEDFVILIDPEKEGYYFLGWTGGITGFSPGNTGDIYMTAIWEAIEYNIYYYFDGDSEPDNPSTYIATYDIETETFILDESAKEGYNFLGWYGNAIFTGEGITYIELGSTGDIYLYAKWEIITYFIIYELDEGINSLGNPNSYTIEDEIWIADPTKSGYTFKGWDENSVGVISKGSTGDILLTAIWSIC